MLLSEAVQAGNCLINVNGSTPYQAVYGRAPNLLPHLVIDPEHPLREPSEDERSWVCRIAIQAMVEGTAIDHLRRALKTQTHTNRVFDVGQMCDYWRTPSSKDSSG